MKKLLLVAVVLAVSASAAFSQGIEWGVKGGLNLATQNLDDYVSMKTRTGFYAGAFLEYAICDFVGIQGELLYSQMGSKREIETLRLAVWNDSQSSVPTEDILYKNDYIVLPILAKLYVLEGLSVDIGPQFGYMISAMEDDFDYYDDFVKTKHDISAAMGLSYKLFGKIDLSARYNLGLNKAKEDETPNVKNRVLQFGIGLRF